MEDSFMKVKPCRLAMLNQIRSGLSQFPTSTQVIVQPHRIGELDALFDAFRYQWNARWNKHGAVHPDRWKVIVDFCSGYHPSS